MRANVKGDAGAGVPELFGSWDFARRLKAVQRAEERLIGALQNLEVANGFELPEGTRRRCVEEAKAAMGEYHRYLARHRVACAGERGRN